MKKCNFFGILILSLFISSCTDDDAIDVASIRIAPPPINAESNFKLDRTPYNFTAGIGNQVVINSHTGYQLGLVGDGITAINGVLEGTGEVVQLVLFNTEFRTDLSGTYTIADTQGNLTAQLAYALNYSSSTIDPDDKLISGTIVVEELVNNEIRITISNGITDQGMQDFTLFFEGGILYLN
jgi:hypothetical protein